MFLDEREGPIIWCDNVLVLGRFSYHTLSFGTDTRIDDRNKGCPFWPVIYRLKEAVTSLKDIIRCNVMGQVVYLEGW